MQYKSRLSGQMSSGSHPKGLSAHGCCSDVLPPFSVSNQILESNSVSPCDNAIQHLSIHFFSDPSLYCPSTVALDVQQVVFLLASNYELWMAFWIQLMNTIK